MPPEKVIARRASIMITASPMGEEEANPQDEERRVSSAPLGAMRSRGSG